jgi:hypothetical protein
MAQETKETVAITVLVLKCVVHAADRYFSDSSKIFTPPAED